MKRKNIIVAISIISISVILSSIFIMNSISTNKQVVAKKEAIVSQQEAMNAKISASNYTVDNPNVILNPYGIAPLSALIAFETSQATPIDVTIVGKNALTTFSHTFESGKVHYLPIYGLYPGMLNEIIIKTNDNQKSVFIKTNPLPANFILPTNVEADYSKLTNDLYFFTPSSQGYTCAYDVLGDVRWYLLNYDIWEIDRLANGRLLLSSERLINPPYYLSGLYEMDMLGKIYTEFSMKGGYHHDYFELSNGNLLVASDDFDNAKGTVEDYIVELDRQSGAIVKEFDLKNVLKMDDGKSDSWINYDWFHNNSVWYDESTNALILSGRHQDAIISIDYASGQLNWIIGDPTNWSEEYQKYFFTPVDDELEWQWSQHAAMVTPEGYIFVLDNGNNKSKNKDEYVLAKDSYTRGVMYEIDTEKMLIKQVFEYGKERGAAYYSPYISDVDYLSENHYIIHSGGISYKDGEILNVPASLGGADTLNSITTELLNDEVIFELSLPTNNYRVEKMGLYANDTYSLDNAERLGDLGKTRVDQSDWGFVLNSVEMDEAYKKRNILFTKEIDRLVMQGTFEKGESVNVLLYQKGKINKYKVVVSIRPYTAMCVFIFNQEMQNDGEVNVTKYINDVEMSGKYSLFLEIDGVIYDSNQYVEF